MAKAQDLVVTIKCDFPRDPSFVSRLAEKISLAADRKRVAVKADEETKRRIIDGLNTLISDWGDRADVLYGDEKGATADELRRCMIDLGMFIKVIEDRL